MLAFENLAPLFDEIPCLKNLMNDSFSALICFSTIALAINPYSCASFNNSNGISLIQLKFFQLAKLQQIMHPYLHNFTSHNFLILR